MSEQLYFLRDTRQIVGNSVMWWAHNDCGYTCDVRRAKIFTQSEAESLAASRSTDVPYPIDEIWPLVQFHVDVQDLTARRKIPHTLNMTGIMGS